MALNLGGAVFGVALFTTITDEVSEGQVKGYRASYYAAIGLAGIGAIVSLFAFRARPTAAVPAEGENEKTELGKETSEVESKQTV
jgi:galactitol-specific phosphotransferase system IIC component